MMKAQESSYKVLDFYVLEIYTSQFIHYTKVMEFGAMFDWHSSVSTNDS